MNSIFVKFGHLKRSDRLCHLYANDTESFEVGTKFIIHGIDNNEICFYISDRDVPKEFSQRLAGRGINLDRLKERNIFVELMLNRKMEATKNSTTFADFMAENIDSALEAGKSLRILMNTRDVFFRFGSTELLRKKAHMDKICSERDVIFMNQFDIAKIASEDLISIMKTHPIIVLEDLVYESPFYQEPKRLLRELGKGKSKLGTLTAKEVEILEYIANGYSNRNIASELSISVKTVETHRANIMKKLDIHNLVDLVKFAMRNRVI